MERIIEGNTEFLCWAILGAMPEPGEVPQPPTQRVKHESVNGWCLTCRRAKCQAPPNPADAMPLPRLPPARTPREQQERIDRARAGRVPRALHREARDQRRHHPPEEAAVVPRQ